MCTSFSQATNPGPYSTNVVFSFSLVEYKLNFMMSLMSTSIPIFLFSKAGNWLGKYHVRDEKKQIKVQNGVFKVKQQ